jgi:type I restriction enzyme S subunit
MSSLPTGWETTSLNNVVTSSVGGMWGSGDESEATSRVRVIRGAEFRDWAAARARLAPERFVPDSGLTSRRLEIGDIVLEVSGGGPTQPVGRTVLIDEQTTRSSDLPLICSNFCRRLTLSKHLDARFVSYQLHHSYLSGDTEQYQRATTNIRNLQVPHFLEGTSLVIPPRAEQERIVAAIEEEFSRLDAAVRALGQARMNQKRLRAATLDGLVGYRAGSKLPLGWRWTTVREVAGDQEAPVLTGPFGTTLGRSDFVHEGIPVLTIGCIGSGGIDLDKALRVSQAKANQLARYRLAAGDVLFSRMATVGRAAVIGEAEVGSLINYHLMRLRLDQKVIRPEYLTLLCAGSSAIDAYLAESNHGVTRPGINTKQLLGLPVALAPVQVQDEIIHTVRQVDLAGKLLLSTISRSEKRERNLRTSILLSAFSGKLVAQEPEDEPASAVIQRIALERPSFNGHKTLRNFHKSRAVRPTVLA